MQDQDHAAIIGAGVIGASWAALFLAAGRRVAVHDPVPGAEVNRAGFAGGSEP